MKLKLGFLLAPVGMVKRLVASRRGKIVLSGLAVLIALGVGIGIALDYHRAAKARAQLEAALNTSALYAASLAVSDAEASNERLTSLSGAHATQNYAHTGDVAISDYAVVDDGQTVTATATTRMNTSFMKFLGQTSMLLTSSFSVHKTGTNLEVALVLDNSRAMNAVMHRPEAKPVVVETHEESHGGAKKEEGHGEAAKKDGQDDHAATEGKPHDEAGPAAAAGEGEAERPTIDLLKVAVKNFVETVMPKEQGASFTKIALVPFNNSVNLGDVALAEAARGALKPGASTEPGSALFTFATSPQLTAFTAERIWGTRCDNGASSEPCLRTLPASTCVSERVGDAAYSDASLAENPAGRAYLPEDGGCSVSPIVPLSTHAEKLNAAIESMKAGNSSAGQVGIAWGWYALSPKAGIWKGPAAPAPYEALHAEDRVQRVHKVMILVTDGGFNSASCNGVITGFDKAEGVRGHPYFYSVKGSGSPADHIGCAPDNGDAVSQAKAMCEAVKASGIEVFVIGLSPEKNQRQELVKACASDEAHLIWADGSSLLGAFSTLADTIVAMRIAP